MANKMLIDATHPEETRVVVVRGNRVEEFDFESAARKQLKGNIYLAKVTRVEPSLQAAFVDYGGNRHGFLAFNEIHPDYYQIPVSDRQALLEQEAADEIAEEDANGDSNTEDATEGEDAAETEANDGAESEDDAEGTESKGEAENNDEDDEDDSDEDNGDNSEDDFDTVGAEDALEEVPERRKRRVRSYKIQEVIKRRQIILIQVVKEERGNKGAALTTYLSLAGRYCVLMPNTARGGGISRKITNVSDRKRLKEIASNLEVAQGMGLIVRTAGANRTKAEIKRDYEYLLRLWENVRDLTLESSAPNLVYEEGSLIKRSIRDLYSKDVDNITIDGEAGYKEAKDFMRMLMPSHAKNVKAYKGTEALFMNQQVEKQLDNMLNPQVTLKSGGYLVINQTEALVAIDVNSGRSTRERNIENTAVATNLEAAAEVARQLRLRDLAGLVVIDFIDMEENRNNRAVERKLKECLRGDRARIQIGRISHFGLLEMSRQRLRSGVLEGSTKTCPLCQGQGFVRSVESAALHILRSIEEYILNDHKQNLIIATTSEVAFYILNQKRDNLLSIESTYSVSLLLEIDDTLLGDNYTIRHSAGGPVVKAPQNAVTQADAASAEEGAKEGAKEEQPRKRRRRRRGRRDRNETNQDNRTEASAPEEDQSSDPVSENPESSSPEEGDGEPVRAKRRRGRRGGRKRRERMENSEAQTSDASPTAEGSEESASEAIAQDPVVAIPEPEDTSKTPEAEEKPKRTRRRAAASESKPKRTRRKKSDVVAETAEGEGENVAVQSQSIEADAPSADEGDEKPKAKSPRRRSRSKKAPDTTDATPVVEESPVKSNGTDDKAAPSKVEVEAETKPVPEPEPSAPVETPAEPTAKPKRGWWQRRISGE
jgi:ribonuclease E